MKAAVLSLFSSIRKDLFMCLKKALILPVAVSTALVTVPVATASAAPAMQERECVETLQVPTTLGADRETVSENDLKQINEDIESAGGSPLPAGTVEYGFNADGDAVAIDSNGRETVLSSAKKMDAELNSVLVQTRSAEGQDDKGVLSAAAATIAGCAGGVIGYDTILKILEKRVSCWALVKFLAKRIGPGLAISCIAGAGGALATYMGW
ncbi:hypothetical protein [uncultured Corynebacterium sp.]|uniref:hypothetical protein n=1 Tax=uncultured Corynebacterium sp. TaxID=159447 RepID=UPI0025929E69|nr:hypothetical protein [uncultured Corynebacterium sp.]